MPPRRSPSPGVVAVFTGADMAADGIGPMRPLWIIRSRDGSPMAEPPRFALARDKVRHVGEPVAAVIAETPAQAADAAERVAVDYEPLPAVTDARAAQARGAPQLHEAPPATSASAGRAATRRRCARRSQRRRTWSRSTSSTIAWSAPRSSRAR